MSDAGEPSGTAGRPMLQVLTGSGFGEIVVVVSRFYGGRKLGTGGLVRAYTGVTQGALAELPTTEKRDLRYVTVAGPYSLVDGVRRLLAKCEASVTSEVFAERVTWFIAVPVDRSMELQRYLTDLSRGEIEVTP